ncbi:hypothetical protein [Bartonella sp. HY761]|uniref:hypothetical protein n=1 Tax=Bartonella sp. HY761 TaxID=2979330 RepID=UPI00220012CE|nr:hypothetical protein [Bartonella sp. HY761]UXN07073.1 hypothetical protein N6A79_03430 [Bartonella sp. HY761]
MSTDYFLHIKTSNPSIEDYYNYTLNTLRKYKVFNVEFTFYKYQQKRRTKATVTIEYPNNLSELNKDVFMKNIMDCELDFYINYNLSYCNDVIYLSFQEYYGINIGDINNDFDYTVAGGNIRTTDIFSFIDVSSSIFVDEKFIWGCLSYEIAPRLEDYYIVFLKKDIAIDLPLRLASNIFDEDKYINLGDFLSDGINMYVHKNYSKFLDG